MMSLMMGANYLLRVHEGACYLLFGLSSCGLMKSSPAAASDRPAPNTALAADAEHRSGIVLANETVVNKSKETPAVDLEGQLTVRWACPRSWPSGREKIPARWPWDGYARPALTMDDASVPGRAVRGWSRRGATG